LATPEARVRVPNVRNPATWSSSPFPVPAPWQYLPLADAGWHITFLRVPVGPENPIVTPATLPTDIEDRDERALLASVILPEAGGHNQYWVPVLEKYRFAQLHTAEWTVIFLRLPLPPEA
jgi:hypothetical protein